MNTNYIKKQAIAGLLGKLFEWTCHSSPEDVARPGPAEPENLQLFRMYLSMLAEMHYTNTLRISDVNGVINYVLEIGRKHGHIFDNGSSYGSWGVRLGELRKIRKVLEIPSNKELFEYGTGYKFGDHTETIKGYKVNNTFLTLELKQDWSDGRKFSIPIEWSDLHTLYKEA